jgi:hypothetical protein
MARKILKMGTLALLLALGAKPSAAFGLTMEELLRKYMGALPEVWKDGGVASNYYFDPLRFDELKAELDTGGEYVQVSDFANTRDWEKGKTFAYWQVFPDGKTFALCLFKKDNSVVGYRYNKANTKKKSSAPLAPKFAEVLRKYIAPKPETWDGEKVDVYYLDPLLSKKFKAELEAGGEYKQTGSWTEKRDWMKGLSYAQWAVHSNGAFLLELANKDNTQIYYEYKRQL